MPREMIGQHVDCGLIRALVMAGRPFKLVKKLARLRASIVILTVLVEVGLICLDRTRRWLQWSAVHSVALRRDRLAFHRT